MSLDVVGEEEWQKVLQGTASTETIYEIQRACLDVEAFRKSYLYRICKKVTSL